MKNFIIKLNSDKEKVSKIRKALDKNDGYCPCQIIKSQDTKCMCKDFLDERKSGYCCCGLYYKEFLED